MPDDRLGPDELLQLIDAMREERVAEDEQRAAWARVQAAQERQQKILDSKQRLKDVGIDAGQEIVAAALDGRLDVVMPGREADR